MKKAHLEFDRDRAELRLRLGDERRARPFDPEALDEFLANDIAAKSLLDSQHPEVRNLLAKLDLARLPVPEDRFFVSDVLKSLLDGALDDEQVVSACAAAARSLYEIWLAPLDEAAAGTTDLSSSDRP